MSYSEIMMAVNSDIKKPLNRLIEELSEEEIALLESISSKLGDTTYGLSALKTLVEGVDNSVKSSPNGLSVNPAYKYYTSENDTTSGRFLQYLDTYSDRKTISSDYLSREGEAIQRENEYWISTSKALRKVDILTGGCSSVIPTTLGTSLSIFVVTKTYVYFREYIDSTYRISRYNKETGEYKTSTTSFALATSSYIGYLCYDDDIYAYNYEDATNEDGSYTLLNGPGYYKVTDNLDDGGTFTFTKISSRLPLANGVYEHGCSDFNDCAKSILELPNGYVVLGWRSCYNYNLYFLLIDTKTGLATTIKTISYGVINSYNYRCTICPIKDTEGNIAGVILGINNTKLSIYKVNVSSTSVSLSLLEEGFYTHYKNQSTTNPAVYEVSWYEDGIFYTFNTYTGEWLKDTSIAKPPTNVYLAFLPKGTRFYQRTDVVVRLLKEKLDDVITIENGILKYVDPLLIPDEKGIYTCPEDGLYDLDGFYNASTHTHRPYGTFF